MHRRRVHGRLERANRGRRIVGAHQRLTDEKSAGARFVQP
jgi:hypothetical protein